MGEVKHRLDPSTVAELLRDGMKHGQRPYLTITSGSMRPLIHIGDEVQLEPVGPADLQVGDIITIVAPATLLTHRFYGWIEKDGQSWLLTRGDRYLNADSPWSAGLLVGRVIARRRQNQRLVLREGRGRWLGRHVAYIAAAEGSLFSPTHTPGGSPSSQEQRRSVSMFFVIQIRRLIYLWITLVVGLLGSRIGK
jgi:hypothetical protein